MSREQDERQLGTGLYADYLDPDAGARVAASFRANCGIRNSVRNAMCAHSPSTGSGANCGIKWTAQIQFDPLHGPAFESSSELRDPSETPRKGLHFYPGRILS